jgi:hypothetical protein
MLELENCFCGLFQESDTAWLLTNLGLLYRTDYRELLINLFELHRNNALFAVLAGKNAKDFYFTKAEAENLSKKLCRLNPNELQKTIEKADCRMMEELSIVDSALKGYLESDRNRLLPKLQAALQQHTFTRFLVTQQGEEQKTEQFDPGKKMPDRQFRAVVANVLQCTDTAEKVELIRNAAHGLQDFCDLLGADCLYDDEFTAVYEALTDRELAMLLHVSFPADLKNETDLSKLPAGEENGDLQWKNELRTFCYKLPAKRKQAIGIVLHKML